MSYDVRRSSMSDSVRKSGRIRKPKSKSAEERAQSLKNGAQKVKKEEDKQKRKEERELKGTIKHITINNKIATQKSKTNKARQARIQTTREMDNFLWSIGDRYHDWWPADRGDISSYKKCGNFKFLPHMIHYIIICESIQANNKRYPATLTLHNILQDTPAKNVRELSHYANITLGNLKGVSNVEENILKEYAKGHKKHDFSILKSLFNNDVNMVLKYKTICRCIFSSDFFTLDQYFGVVCDAGASPFCTLFKNIILYYSPNIATKNITLDGVKDICNKLKIPLMYMIHTPQTIADSAFTQGFIECLILYRFPKNEGYTFVCKSNYFADDYKIVFQMNGTFDEDCSFNYNIKKDNHTFTIPYGIRPPSSSSSSSSSSGTYRNVGPSLYDLMLYYIHLNSLKIGADNIFNNSIYNNNKIELSFNQLQFPEYTYDDDEKEYPGSQNIPIHTRFQDIYELVNNALGKTRTGQDPRSLMTYKPRHPNSLINIPRFEELPPNIMIDIKHEGDASQVLAAQILNDTDDKFKDRIVFISGDRPCVANSVYKGLRTIYFGSNYITVYNYEGDVKREGGNGECEIELLEITELDVKELMLSIGMYANRYLKTYMNQYNKRDDVLHRRVLYDLYEYIFNMYNKYNKDLENDINGIYEDGIYEHDVKDFMKIVSKLYYKEKVDSLEELIHLSNIYNSNFKQPTITLTKYISSMKSKKSLSLESKKSKNIVPVNKHKNVMNNISRLPHNIQKDIMNYMSKIPNNDQQQILKYMSSLPNHSRKNIMKIISSKERKNIMKRLHNYTRKKPNIVHQPIVHQNNRKIEVGSQ